MGIIFYQHSLDFPMVRMSVMQDALKNICNAEKSGKRQVILRPISKTLVKFLALMQKKGYIAEYTIVDDARCGKIVVDLNGRLNKCGVISPRFDLAVKGFENFVNSILPSRQFGHVILSTNEGIMTHTDAFNRQIGGKVIGYFY